MKKITTSLFLLLIGYKAISQNGETVGNGNSISEFLSTLILPALIGVIGYLLKSGYDLLLNRQKLRRSVLEEKLKNFYWPILTRLEQNTSIWRAILQKRNENDELQKKIGQYVEENIIIKNHREIVSIIINYRHLAKFDDKLSDVLQKYLRHVGIYEGILRSEVPTLPGLLGAPYPNDFDEIISERTKQLQIELDKKTIL
ncbi:hypothetical protein FEDK69T_24800 [Flavobacterium enshiense DK69]|uniref:Uncharacterized protein n=1 Tax=Flavobacterium enshiense DK69 TaxID=1107311 RepID=V6S3Z6_9FLAO|nr:hypothetical protein [Flavobacterium enshiense]ESU21413.1 hypothetical protein FEDK69T_24800 [Flavobacterium enshiense DK69]KGO97078.1 hypothetical protein Q767_00285 [Flavobacterium enshiense DK69]